MSKKVSIIRNNRSALALAMLSFFLIIMTFCSIHKAHFPDFQTQNELSKQPKLTVNASSTLLMCTLDNSLIESSVLNVKHSSEKEVLQNLFLAFLFISLFSFFPKKTNQLFKLGDYKFSINRLPLFLQLGILII